MNMYIYLLHTLHTHCTFSRMHSMKDQAIFHILYFMLHCACVLNNVLLSTVIEMFEILYGRVRTAFS